MNIHETFNEPDSGEPRADAGERHPIAILSGVYLDAGLPLEAAAQAAIADYESLFDKAALGAT